MQQKAPQPQPPITVQHALAPATGNVVMIFSQKIDMLIFTPEQAALFVIRVLEGVKQAKPACADGFSWPQRETVRG